MNKVKELGKHTIYYFSNGKIKYYINVPHKEFNVTNICLEFLEDTSKYDPDISNIEIVRQNVIEYYEQVDDDNITLVMPMLKESEKNLFLSLNINKLNIIEKIMALYINSSYIILANNKINVNKEVFLIENNKYINFVKYFKNKHNSRIIVKRLIEIANNNIENIPVIDNQFNKEVDGIGNRSEKNEPGMNVPFSINENILNDVIYLDIKPEKQHFSEPLIEKNIEIDNNINEFINEKNEKKEDKLIPRIEKKNKEDNNKVIVLGEKKATDSNNDININDLTRAGINGTIPGNVTINIEKLITENKNENKEEDNEVSELDEDISDADDFDENEDFDIDAIDVSEAVLSSDDGNKNYRTITSGGIKFVVGKKGDENLKNIELKEKSNNLDLNKPKLAIEVPTNIIKGEDQVNKNAGFATYFTLFFVTISALFLIVYIIIK